jgi:transposase-like protein
MEKCINCGGKNLVKYGFTNRKNSENSQKWKCKDCSTIRAEELRIKRMSDQDKDMVDKMVSEGIGYRKIQRLLNFKSLYTIQGYLKKSKSFRVEI